MLTRQQKEETVAMLRDKLVKANVIVAVDYRGLTVAQASDLRSRLRSVADGQIEYRVAKNTLLKRAIAGTEMEGLHAYLTGPTAVALATSQGDFALAMALGMILLGLALTVNVLLQMLQGRGDALGT